jgi:uncharacterized protein (TIGR02611 family)
LYVEGVRPQSVPIRAMTAHTRHTATLLDRIKDHWQDFKRGRPGHRFQERYRRRDRQGHGLFAKAVYLVSGFGLLVAGIILMPAPGPGFLVVFVGAGLIAKESHAAARVLDWIELRLWRLTRWARRTWQSCSPALKALIVLVTALTALIIAFLAYALLFG